MILPLFYYDHPMLRKKAKPIEKITDEVIELAHNMVESMIHYNGVGLAGPQIGQLLRLFVIRDESIAEDGSYQLGEPEIFMNPTLSKPSKESVIMPEGCLSIPGLHRDVERPASICISYQTIDGHTKTENVAGFRARVMMHENDHLNGVLYIDRLSPRERKELGPQLRSVKQEYKSPS